MAKFAYTHYFIRRLERELRTLFWEAKEKIYTEYPIEGQIRYQVRTTYFDHHSEIGALISLCNFYRQYYPEPSQGTIEFNYESDSDNQTLEERPQAPISEDSRFLKMAKTALQAAVWIAAKAVQLIAAILLHAFMLCVIVITAGLVALSGIVEGALFLGYKICEKCCPKSFPPGKARLLNCSKPSDSFIREGYPSQHYDVQERIGILLSKTSASSSQFGRVLNFTPGRPISSAFQDDLIRDSVEELKSPDDQDPSNIEKPINKRLFSSTPNIKNPNDFY